MVCTLDKLYCTVLGKGRFSNTNWRAKSFTRNLVKNSEDLRVQSCCIFGVMDSILLSCGNAYVSSFSWDTCKQWLLKVDILSHWESISAFYGFCWLNRTYTQGVDGYAVTFVRVLLLFQNNILLVVLWYMVKFFHPSNNSNKYYITVSYFL